MKWRIPLSDIDFDEQEVEAVSRVLRSKWISMGEVSQEFESAFSKCLNVRHSFAVNNGTAALHLACRAAGFGPGDEVIVPSLTFVATANSIAYTGALPVFADISSTADFNISVNEIKKRITSRTKGIMVVHYGGFPCDMEAIMDMASEHHLLVIEDAAHAVGGSLFNRSLGTLGDVGCFSFFSNKNMTTGEGGMIVTNRDEIADRIKLLRSHGMTSLSWDRYQGHSFSYDVKDLGYNYRITEMQSALGLVQLRKLPENNRKRKQLIVTYRDLLANVEGLSIPFNQFLGEPSYHIFPILLDKKINRVNFMTKMKDRGIQCSIHYPPIHQFEFYRQTGSVKTNDLVKTEFVAQHEVTLPLFPGLKMEDMSLIVDSVKESINQ